MSFDDHRPPQRALVDDCVHCGFCLPSCPTYALWGQEMDSPRGRVHLIAQALDGAPLAGPVAAHMDSCLSCMGCLTSCPSGVKYDQLVTATRAQIERQVRRPPGERAARAPHLRALPPSPPASSRPCRARGGRGQWPAPGAAAPVHRRPPAARAPGHGVGGTAPSPLPAHRGPAASGVTASRRRSHAHRLRPERLFLPCQRGHRPRPGGRGL